MKVILLCSADGLAMARQAGRPVTPACASPVQGNFSAPENALAASSKSTSCQPSTKPICVGVGQVGVGSLNHETGGAVLEVRVQGAVQSFDIRALAIVDEAVAMGVLPNLPVFRSTEAELIIDLKRMPAAVAEVRP